MEQDIKTKNINCDKLLLNVNKVLKKDRYDQIDCENGSVEKKSNCIVPKLKKSLNLGNSSDVSVDTTKSLLCKMLSNLKLNNLPINSNILANDNDQSETTDDEVEEYIEYVFNPRQYFLQSVCQLCKESISQDLVSCNKCNMVFYCSTKHMSLDTLNHRDFCMALNEMALQQGDHIYNNTNGLTRQEYQTVRFNTINMCERTLNRPLLPFEKEILLFPRICNNPDCREWRSEELEDCKFCKQFTHCKRHRNYQKKIHNEWCKQLKLFEKIIIHQAKFGKIKPVLPSKILVAQSLQNISTIGHVFKQLYRKLSDIGSIVHYAELTQIASPALTIWFALRLLDLIQIPELVIHIIGAEQHFEVDTLDKWEVFLMHLIPRLNSLDIVFVGPELNIPDSHIAVLQKQRLCKTCRRQNKKINYHFENSLYHDYVSTPSFKRPSIVCYFNPGLYRSTGFNITDTWPETIRATVHADCPVLVTSYTNYESSLDLKTYLRESDRLAEIILPSIVNPFRSQHPERNFVSEDQSPLIYKNFYMFLLK